MMINKDVKVMGCLRRDYSKGLDTTASTLLLDVIGNDVILAAEVDWVLCIGSDKLILLPRRMG